MSVTAVQKNPEERTLIVTSEFPASRERVWQLWAEPRQLERWWGPPSHPATVTEHDLRPGGSVSYYMTGPGGDRSHGWWQVEEADPPASLVFRDGFAGPDRKPASGMPTIHVRVELSELEGGGTRMRMTSTFNTADEMERLLDMGMEEGMVQALGQIDALLS